MTLCHIGRAAGVFPRLAVEMGGQWLQEQRLAGVILPVQAGLVLNQPAESWPGLRPLSFQA